MTPIFALSELGGHVIGVGDVSKIFDGAMHLLTIAGTMLDTVTTNPILTLFFSAGVVAIAVRIVRKLKRV